MASVNQKCRLLIVAVLMIFLKEVNCYSGGAPSDACSDLTPKHGIPAQTSRSPFELALTSNGNEVNVKLFSTTSNTRFMGFIIQAIVVDHDNLRGEFHSPGNRANYELLDCGHRSAVTHDHPSAKASVSMVWVKPQGFTGLVTFKATAVQRFKTFWTNIEQTIHV